MQILAGEDEPDDGTVKWGVSTSRSYFPKDNSKYFDGCELNLVDWLRQYSAAGFETQNESYIRGFLGRMLFSGDDVFKQVNVLSGGEKTRLALATLVTSRANVRLLDEPTNNLDPASRDEILKAIAKYEGASVLVTHDEGAVQALNPERVLLMPDGDEDLWNDSYLELVAEE